MNSHSLQTPVRSLASPAQDRPQCNIADLPVNRWTFGWSKIACALLADRPAYLTTLVALCLGFGYAFIVLGPAVMGGAAPFWDLPTGLVGGTLDIRNALAGYWWFVQDAWHWPLLAVFKPNWPAGANAELFDVAPAVAIFGKLLRTMFGWEVNPYPWWVTGCFLLNAVALAALVRALGQRSVIGAILAGAFGAIAPVVQHRFGHMSLMAHWLPLLTLACYLYGRAHRLDNRAAAVLIGLCFLATCVHLYLYVMTAAIAAAACLQAVLDRRVSIRSGAFVLTLIMAAGALPLWGFGLLGGVRLSEVSGDFNRYSMNLLAPFWPQTSGVFGWTGIYWLTRGSIGATPGQYEGFNYLGVGALLLAALAIGDLVLKRPRDLAMVVRRNAALLLALALLTIWALSSRIYLGPYLVASYEPPRVLTTTVLAWFRSCGRLFWPVGWLLVGFAIARAPVLFRPGSACVMMAMTLLLQWTDVSPWRARFAALFGTPVRSAFGTPADAARIANAIAKAGAVIVTPPVFCSTAGADYSSPLNMAAMEVQLMAARANARMASVYLSRTVPECTQPRGVGSPRVEVRLRDSNKSLEVRNDADPDNAECFDLPIAQVCSYR